MINFGQPCVQFARKISMENVANNSDPEKRAVLRKFTAKISSFLELTTNWKIRIYRSVCTSVNDFLHHRKIAVSFFQFGRSYPNLPVSWDILTSFVQNLHKHI